MKNYDIKPYEDEVTNDYVKEEMYLRAKKRVEKLKGFYWHLAVYIVINIFLISMIITKSNRDFWDFSTFSTAIFWGIGLMFHGFSVFGQQIFFGRNWEEKKIKEYMDKDKQGWE